MMRYFKKFFFFLFLFSLFLAICMPFTQEAFGKRSERESISKQLGLMMDVIGLIRRDFVDDSTIPKLEEGALRGMLKSLDPYSQYLDKQAYNDLKIETSGEFGGLGLEVSVKGGLLHVITALDGTPADRAGVRPGDSIIKIDDIPTRDMTLSEAVRKMRGPRGTKSKLTLMREGENQVIELDIPRDIVKIQSIKAAKLLEDNIGYVRLSAFQEKSGDDFKKRLEDLTREGMSGLILDVRNNAGGLLVSAVEVAEHLIPKGKLIVSTKGRNPKKDTLYQSKSEKVFEPRPIVVLINKGSASGSEILAGVIQDYKMGLIVGVKSFGKGSIQSLVPLPGGRAIRLTTSRYYTPSGRLIHEKGVDPDIVVEWRPGDGAEDIQLKRAIEIMRQLKDGVSIEEVALHAAR